MSQGLYLPTNVRVIYRLYISDDAFSRLFLFKFEFLVLKLNETFWFPISGTRLQLEAVSYSDSVRGFFIMKLLRCTCDSLLSLQVNLQPLPLVTLSR